MIKVLLADDQTLVRQGIRLLLEIEPDIQVVGQAADGREALQQVEVLRPDVPDGCTHAGDGRGGRHTYHQRALP